MKVTVNGDERELAPAARVADVVSDFAGRRRSGIAVALNGEIVPRSEWSEVTIEDGDRLEVLSAIGGG
ncbi:MAG TPA: sulfur carrier protein ThiS [Actinomycetota bacterium]|jgi:sulfur carrier protein